MLQESIPYVLTSRVRPAALCRISLIKDEIGRGMETALNKPDDDIKFKNVYSRFVLRVDAAFEIDCFP